MAIPLDLGSFAGAIDRLAEGVTALRAQPDNALIRDAVIQRFEFTYELAHKMLRRFLTMSAADPQAMQQLSFQDLIRTGSEQDLLKSDWERWREWRHARSITSHAYDEKKAREVAAGVPDFLVEARHLHARLGERSRRP